MIRIFMLVLTLVLSTGVDARVVKPSKHKIVKHHKIIKNAKKLPSKLVPVPKKKTSYIK